MRRVWILDTDTKGTGAEMVPLDKARKRPAPRTEPVFVPPKPRPHEPKPVEPRPPRRFKVLDVMTRQLLADGTRARATLDVLSEVRSMADVNVYIWEPEGERWRLLTFAEQRLMWDRAATPPQRETSQDGVRTS